MNKAEKTGTGRARPGVRAQLMLFMGGGTLVTLLLVWALITYWLAPQYTRMLRATLTERAAAIAARIDASDDEVARREFGYLFLNEEFWDALKADIENDVIDVDGCCVDISDTTCRSVQYYENMVPCVLHDTVTDFGGNLIFSRDTAVIMQARKQLFGAGELFDTLESGGNRQMLVGVLTADARYGVIVSANLAQIATAAEVLSRMLPPIALLLLLLNLLFATLFSRWFTGPVQRLSAGARRIAAGDYDVRIDVDRRDELGLLAQEFNHMAGEVKHSAQLEKDILANVSHDLRTPLTLIKGYAETIRDLSGADDGKRTEQCNIIMDETDRLSALVNSVLELSKVQSGAQKPEPVDFDMSELCFEVAGLYDAVCEQNGWTLRLEADRACPVHADPAMMERVLHNLLGNATQHLGEDGVFILRAVPQAGGGCRVEVEDHGPGIPPEELPYLFDRYYRARKDAGRPGTGLGLSITKAILQQHGFAFGVNSAVGHGTTFWFETAKAPENLKK